MHGTNGLPGDLVGLSEACGCLPGSRPGKKLNISTLYRWCREGRLPSWRIGRHWFVSRADVLGMLRAQAASAPAAVRTAGHERAVAELRRQGLM